MVMVVVVVVVAVLVCEMSNFTSLVKINLDTVEVRKLLLGRMKNKQNKSIRKVFNTSALAFTDTNLTDHI